MRISDWSSDGCSSDLFALAPAGVAADAIGQDPDLEQRRFLVLEVEFAVGHAGAHAHHLDIDRRGAAAVAHRVAMADSAGADTGDDFHVSDRQSVLEGKSVSVRVEHGGSRIIQK